MLQIKELDIYYGRKKIVKNASFEISDGEIVGLIGPNGAGKTTIMKTILGLTKFRGNISFNGKEITDNNHEELNNVGALIENPAIYPFLTGKANLELYSTNEQSTSELITRLGMDSYINKKAGSYSIGMKQKLGIALALLNNPKFVILDEPMNGLDIESTILIRQIIREYSSRGTSFLISSHVLSELQKVMTSVIIINHGEIIMNSPIEEFNKSNSSSYLLRTTDMDKTFKLLNENSIPVSKDENHFIIKDEYIDKSQKIIFDHQIWLIELAPNELTFEQNIINILQKKRGENNAN
ncbi:ABC transporter ATP-binding protein [Companilactobacillus metriopterae]|uniref:ABC transporter ATP-binding protein n=1 Tax=Companilactobacillus metriopterae TaxID=1909267 RepID=UPI00100A390B|nr:ATP-binding cassette domain-containing protein [Companilactobacillus metriopterae]